MRSRMGSGGHFPRAVRHSRLSDVLAGIDCERTRLQWQPKDLQQYCLDQYGQIRASLTDDELIRLLLGY